MSRLFASLVCLAVFASTSLRASDWTQWFGSNHDGTSDEKMGADWGTSPKVLWRVPMGDGLGSMVVAGGKAFCLAETAGPADPGTKVKGAEKGGAESVVCLDANTGKTLWSQPIGPTILHENSGNDGPRSTPAIVDGHVYAVGTYLNVACLDAKTGKPVWAHDCAAEFGGDVQLKTAGIGAWGCANSAVVDDGLVFVHGGGAGAALMAFDAKTGEIVWKIRHRRVDALHADRRDDSRPAPGDFLHEKRPRQPRYEKRHGTVALSVPLERLDGDLAGDLR